MTLVFEIPINFTNGFIIDVFQNFVKEKWIFFSIL